MKSKPKTITAPGADYSIRVLGAHNSALRDFYHALLLWRWPTTVVAIAAMFMLANTVFAFAYMLTDGVANVHPGSFLDCFFFSVQTMGTIGYGYMYPATTTAEVVVVAETITSVTLTALATGLVFAKFSRASARVLFSDTVTISPMNGVPTLRLRLGNQRNNQIIDARVKVQLLRTEKLKEGGVFYRMVDVNLVRENILSLSRSWTALHVIDESSPLWQATPESLASDEAELHVLLMGLDDTTLQPVHALHRYFSQQILWGRQHVDILTERDSGVLELDLRRFHEHAPTEPTPSFPYPKTVSTKP
ncbi:MAG: ion channel [Deltaproteobacteria bacterium]|nr:ion channel [Deltaproteobacteria bacterium]